MAIRQHEGGKKVNVITRDLKLSHSTVSTILNDKERSCEAVKRFCTHAIDNYNEATDWACPRNGEIAVHLNGSSDI